MNKRIQTALLLLGVLLLMAGCATTIADIQADPGQYAGQDVSLSGEVERVISIPLTALQVYELKDATESMAVFSVKEKKKGQRVSITARVVGFDGSSESAEKSAQVLADFLKDQEVLNPALADKAATKALDIIKGVAKAAKGSFFLIEL